MNRRILALTRALLAGDWWGEGGSRLPFAPFLFHASLAGALCGIARGELGLYGYALLGLSLPLALTTLPLLGELGPLLRADAASEWIGSQPIRPFELRAGRVLCIALLLGLLALGSLVPVALLAPDEFGLGARLGLVAAGIAQTYVVAAALLVVQAVLGGRAEGALVLVQTLVFCLVIVGFIAGLRLLPYLAELTGPEAGLWFYPPAWFGSLLLPSALFGASAESAQTAPLAAPLAAPLVGPFAWTAIGTSLAALIAFLAAPFPPAGGTSRAHSPLAFLLAPLRRLATRLWLTPRERPHFDLVYDALPTERDFVMRAYPLMAIPLAFLLLGADPGDVRGEGLLAILAFSPGIYLPFLLVHVPATATPGARWLVDTSPTRVADEQSAAAKAVFLRFLVPLYVVLLGLMIAQSSLTFALRLLLPSAVVAYASMRISWTRYVGAPPLSTPAAELGSAWSDDFTGRLFGVGLLMAMLAILTYRFVSSWELGLAVALAAVAYEWAARARAIRSSAD